MELQSFENQTGDGEGAAQGSNVELWYREYRPYLFTIAYRMLGTVSDAEDIVQDLFLSLSASVDSGLKVRHEKAYLAKMAVNRCLNFLNSAAKRRETYLGPWLPEPLIDTSNPLPADAAERGEAVSYAFMVLLERLAPAERAVFVLRETMGYEYAEIASLMEKSEANCRQVFSRAKRKLDAERTDEPKPAGGRELALVRRFAKAFRSGQAAELVRLLADDAILLTDGGGKVRAAINPIYGPDRVQILLSRIASRRLHDSRFTEFAIGDGDIGLAAWDEDRLTAIFCFEWSDGDGDRDGERTLRRVYNIFNPDKLAHLKLPPPSPSSGPAQGPAQS